MLCYFINLVFSAIKTPTHEENKYFYQYIYVMFKVLKQSDLFLYIVLIRNTYILFFFMLNLRVRLKKKSLMIYEFAFSVVWDSFRNLFSLLFGS